MRRPWDEGVDGAGAPAEVWADARRGGAPGGVFVSRPVAASGVAALGRTHYSYGFAARSFTRMLGEAGLTVTPVAHPEQFKSSTYAQVNGLGEAGRPHLIFRSTEEIRTIPGAYNIACFAWEFDVLSEPGLPHVPALEAQTTMLSTCDEVWAPSRFTESVLRAHGITRTCFLPAPVFAPLWQRLGDRSSWDLLADAPSIELVSTSGNFLFGYPIDVEEDYVRLELLHARPLGAQPRLRKVIEQGGRIFTSVLNPYDKRKNLPNLIDGFMLATQGREDCVLVLKLITSGVVENPAGYLYHQLRLLLGHPHCVQDDRILLVGGYLSDEKMSALYNGSDFYLCTSIAEGQNVPILEAMLHGCLPVSTLNTAMADYLTPDDCVPIRERRFTGVISGLAGDVAGRRYGVDYADRYAIAEAVEAALALPSAEVERRAQCAREVVRSGYSPEALAPRALRRLSEVDPSGALAGGSTG